MTLAFLAFQWLAQRPSSDAAVASLARGGAGAGAKGIVELAGTKANWIGAYGRGGGIPVAAQY